MYHMVVTSETTLALVYRADRALEFLAKYDPGEDQVRQLPFPCTVTSAVVTVEGRSGRSVRERCLLACQQSCDLTQDGGLLLLTAHRHTCSQCDTADSYHIVNQAQIQEELGV